MLEDLSKVANMPLMCTSEMKQEVLVISVDHVPLSELMKRIATVTSGQWQSAGVGFCLSASLSTRAKEESDAMALREAALAKDIREGETAGVGSFGGVISMYSGFSSRYEWEILAAADPSLIARLAPGERIVFSTRPNRLQHSFSKDVSAASESLVAEQSQIMDRSWPNVRGRGQPPVSPPSNVERVTLAVARLEGPGVGLMASSLSLIDASGKPLICATVPLRMPGELFSDSEPPKETRGSPTPIDLANDTRQFDRAFRDPSPSSSKWRTINSHVVEKICRPDIFDPLSFRVTDVLFALARKLHRPLVADPNDNIFLSWESSTVEDMERELRRGHYNRILKDPDWLLIAPARLTPAREPRSDRTALGELVRAARANGLASLDDLAAYAMKAPNPSTAPIESDYLINLIPGSMDTQGDPRVWEMLRIYGALDPILRNRLLAGERVSLHSLTPYELEQVRVMAHSDQNLLLLKKEVDHESGVTSQLPLRSAPSMFGGSSGGEYHEATDLLPNDLPDGDVGMETRTEPIAISVTAEGDLTGEGRQVQGPQELADERFFEARNSQTNSTLVKLGQISVYTFTFRLGRRLTMQVDLQDNRFDPLAPLASLSSLPTEFQRAIQAAYVRTYGTSGEGNVRQAIRP